MKLGVFASFITPTATPDTILDIGKRVDEMGLDSLWMGEHVVIFDEMEFGYPGTPDGKLPIPEGGGLPETVVTLAYLAGTTKNIRFGTGVTLLPQRNPIYTAKEFATLDYLTGGRVDLGLGVGWCKEEVLACGNKFEDRGARTDEIIDLMKMLWTQPVTDYNGKYFQVKGVRMDPKPVQKPHIPLIVGGFSPPAIRRAVRVGAGWLGFGINPEITKQLIAGFEAALSAAGRTRDSFEIIVTPGTVNAEDVRQFKDLGVDRLVPLMDTSTPEAIDGRFKELEEFAKIVA